MKEEFLKEELRKSVEDMVLGEKRMFNGECYILHEIYEEKLDCAGCEFSNDFCNCMDSYNHLGDCSSGNRKDERDFVFVKSNNNLFLKI